MSDLTPVERIFETIRMQVRENGMMRGDPYDMFPFVQVELAKYAARYDYMAGKTLRDWSAYCMKCRNQYIKMSKLSPVTHIFETIRKQVEDNGVCYDDPLDMIAAVEAELTKYTSKYWFMAGKTFVDYSDYTEKCTKDYIDSHQIPGEPTAQQFWNAAYNFGTESDTAAGCELQLMFGTGRLKPMILGKLYGKYTLKLSPCIGALPVFDEEFDAPLPFAATNAGAIFYADGHPSEGQIYTQKQIYPSSSRETASIHPSEDDKLRRCASLGYVMMENQPGQWRKTGHVLVIDMDLREVRHRHPWFVLAPHWPTDFEKIEAVGFTQYVPKSVPRNHRSNVFPGCHNRTSICSIRARQPSEQGKVVLKQFGPDFEFELNSYRGHSRTRPSNKGPDLAEAMEWYWNEKLQRQVCYREGMEYMRFDPATDIYTFPTYTETNIAGEQALFGETLPRRVDLEVELPLR